MRGLTALEFDLLVLAEEVGGQPCSHRDCPNTPDEEYLMPETAARALVARGLLTLTPCGESGPGWYHLTVTEMGKLALTLARALPELRQVS